MTTNNSVYATWSAIDARHMIINDFIIQSDTTKEYYHNFGYDKRPIYVHLDSTAYCGAYQLLLSKMEELRPDYIFRLRGDPNWFFIKGDKVVVFEHNYGTLLYYEDALEYLKQLFTQDNYWPSFHSYRFYL